MKTVDQHFNRFSRSLLAELASEPGDYWNKALDFWEQVKFKDITSISDGQLKWLVKIQDGVVEKAKES